jgi:hypothetical protein
MRRCGFFLFLCVLVSPAWAADPDAFPDLNIHDAAAVREASRVLEEELKLAARPQTYVLIDLVIGAIHIKGRGVELHHMTIARSSAIGTTAMTGIFRLRARPPVARRKVDPRFTLEQEPISLADMPVQYELSFVPSLTVEVHPAADERPLLWPLAASRLWWRHIKEWARGWLSDPGPPHPYLQLTLSVEQAQSLAWSLVDGMPVLIRRQPEQ